MVISARLHVNSINTILQNIEFYIFKRYDESSVSHTTSRVSHMLDGQQSSVTKDLAINVNQFETSNITYMILFDMGIW